MRSFASSPRIFANLTSPTRTNSLNTGSPVHSGSVVPHGNPSFLSSVDSYSSTPKLLRVSTSACSTRSFLITHGASTTANITHVNAAPPTIRNEIRHRRNSGQATQTIIAGKQSSNEAFDSAINPHNTPNTAHKPSFRPCLSV